MVARRIDLNADLGEGIGDDGALLGIVTSANIATGAHAGGGAVLERAVATAARRGVAIGAHPSYRDRTGFGRVSHLAVLRVDPSARSHVVGDLVEQILLVAREAGGHGEPLAHVKAHGSLYNDAVHDAVAAEVVAEAVLGAEHALGYRVAVLTQPGGQLARIAAGHGLVVIAEGFADRGYLSTGELVPRAEPGAVHSDAASMVAQALALAAGRVTPVDGPQIAVAVDSLCVHGDTPGAVAAARAIRAALEDAAWEVVAPAGAGGSRRRSSSSGGEGGHGEPGDPRTALRAPAGRNAAEAIDADGLAVLAFGDRALLIEPADGRAPGTPWVLRLADRARRTWPHAMVVAGLGSVLVAFDAPSERPEPRGRGVIDLLSADGQVDGTGLHAEASGAHPGGRRGPASPGPATPRHHLIGTRYDGPDLAEVAAMLEVPAVEVVDRHRAAAWTVAAVGFSPGFGYLTTTDPLFAGVVRRPDPRPRVPRGSVALAAGMCAVYPSATPGGWQLIGSSRTELFDVDAEHPALLRVGDVVRFTQES